MFKKTIIIFISFFTYLNLFSIEFKISEFSRMNNYQLEFEEKQKLKEDDSFNKFANLGFIYFFMDDEKINNAIENFNKALSLNKSNILKAYLGSSYTKLGKNEKNLIKKINYVNKGVNIMEEAFEENKNDYQVSILLVNNFIELPDTIFHKLNDALKILENITKKKKFLTRTQEAQVLYLRSIIHFKKSKKDKGIKLCNLIISDYKDTKYFRLANNELKKYGVIK